MILKNVKSLLKGKKFVVVSLGDSIRSASERMALENERAASVVVDGDVHGIVSEKDIVHNCVAKGLDPNTTQVSEVMTANPVTIDGKDTVAHAIEKMLEGNFHHLPVIEDGALIGMVYSDDIPEEYRLLLEHYKELRS